MGNLALPTTKIDSVKTAIGHDLLMTLREQFLMSAIHNFTGADENIVKSSWKRAEETMAEISKRFISNTIRDGKTFEPEVIKSAIQKVIDEQRKIAVAMVAELVGADRFSV